MGMTCPYLRRVATGPKTALRMCSPMSDSSVTTGTLPASPASSSATSTVTTRFCCCSAPLGGGGHRHCVARCQAQAFVDLLLYDRSRASVCPCNGQGLEHVSNEMQASVRVLVTEVVEDAQEVRRRIVDSVVRLYEVDHVRDGTRDLATPPLDESLWRITNRESRLLVRVQPESVNHLPCEVVERGPQVAEAVPDYQGQVVGQLGRRALVVGKADTCSLTIAISPDTMRASVSPNSGFQLCNMLVRPCQLEVSALEIECHAGVSSADAGSATGGTHAGDTAGRDDPGADPQAGVR